jgi:hypothetical protein
MCNSASGAVARSSLAVSFEAAACGSARTLTQACDDFLSVQSPSVHLGSSATLIGFCESNFAERARAIIRLPTTLAVLSRSSPSEKVATPFGCHIKQTPQGVDQIPQRDGVDLGTVGAKLISEPQK